LDWTQPILVLEEKKDESAGRRKKRIWVPLYHNMLPQKPPNKNCSIKPKTINWYMTKQQWPLLSHSKTKPIEKCNQSPNVYNSNTSTHNQNKPSFLYHPTKTLLVNQIPKMSKIKDCFIWGRQKQRQIGYLNVSCDKCYHFLFNLLATY